MDIGALSAGAASQAASGMLKSSLQTQSGLVSSLMEKSLGQDESTIGALALAEQGKGQIINTTV